MKSAVPAAVFLVFFAAACGKVGDPKPPINRTPLAASDINASQSGQKVTVTWTNPARYVDNNDVTDLAFVRILRNGMEIGRVEAKAPGQPQSYEIDVTDSLNSDLTLTVQVGTRRDRFSTMSSQVSIRPVDVPGAPRGLAAVVDQERITLTWEAPQSNTNLAELYLVQRSDRPGSVEVTTNRYEDASFEADKKYDYTVTAARAQPRVPGASAPISVTATDKLPPATPAGLEIFPSPPMGVFLKWNRNPERDFKEVRIYRSDQPGRIWRTTTTDAATDDTYRPGLSYVLEAVDKAGNASPKSAAQAGP